MEHVAFDFHMDVVGFDARKFGDNGIVVGILMNVEREAVTAYRQLAIV
jgi:hypothetical protein